MNSVKSVLRFNRYCSTCRYRLSDPTNEDRYSDDCVQLDVLRAYLIDTYKTTALEKNIISVECRRVVKYCEGEYYEPRTARYPRKKV